MCLLAREGGKGVTLSVCDVVHPPKVVHVFTGQGGWEGSDTACLHVYKQGDHPYKVFFCILLWRVSSK